MTIRKTIKGIIILIGAGCLIVAGHLVYLMGLAPKETYPNDDFLAGETNRNALIIVAHDDDMVGSSGTISMLCRNGWSVRQVCFYQQGGLYAEKDSIKNPIRKKDFQKAASIQGIKEVFPIDFNLRKNMEAEASYLPMPYAAFSSTYKVDSLSRYIADYIEAYRPSVIFTLDDVIGGYGHPDHVLVSRIVTDYYSKHKGEGGCSIRRIYQPVFPPSQSGKVLDGLPIYEQAKKAYQVSGMPNPDVQVHIENHGAIKKEAMSAYSTEQNSIRKIWPHYNQYPSWLFFRIFDREFFRIIQ